jgi:hypothetical protein
MRGEGKVYGGGWVSEAEGNWEVEIVRINGEKDGKLRGGLIIFWSHFFLLVSLLPNLSDSGYLGGGCSPWPLGVWSGLSKPLAFYFQPLPI